jgi:hypothetical protein
MMYLLCSSCCYLKNYFFVFACFQASAAPRPENADSDEKDALFGLDTQVTISGDASFLLN